MRDTFDQKRELQLLISILLIVFYIEASSFENGYKLRKVRFFTTEGFNDAQNQHHSYDMRALIVFDDFRSSAYEML